MQMLNLRTLALSLPLGMALSLCVACGGDDDGGSDNTGGTGGSTNGGNKGGSTSGGKGSGVSLPGDKVLGSLSDKEVEQLCDDLGELASSGPLATAGQEFACLMGGVLAGAFSGPSDDDELQAACQVAYDECKAEPLESEPAECEKPDPACTATVSELKACWDDASKAMQELIADIPSCSEITLESLESLDPDEAEVADPPSCVTLREKCPGLDTPGDM